MDFAHQHRQRLIASAGGETPSIEEVLAASLKTKRERAIRWLGCSWVHHLSYDPARHPHHNPACKVSATLDKYRMSRGAA